MWNTSEFIYDKYACVNRFTFVPHMCSIHVCCVSHALQCVDTSHVFIVFMFHISLIVHMFYACLHMFIYFTHVLCMFPFSTFHLFSTFRKLFITYSTTELETVNHSPNKLATCNPSTADRTYIVNKYEKIWKNRFAKCRTHEIFMTLCLFLCFSADFLYYSAFIRIFRVFGTLGELSRMLNVCCMCSVLFPHLCPYVFHMLSVLFPYMSGIFPH
jgi:hypothetical protein